jgi:UDP-N-acetylglucosamine 4-epimerase
MKVLVTGGAGFIGSNLVERLMTDKRVSLVKVQDNLSTGNLSNLSSFDGNPKFRFIKGDIRNYEQCLDICKDIDLISHQAALGSVPRSIQDPLTTNDVNITGTLNVFNAAKENKVSRVVYAASSSTYGDHPKLPKTEENIGNPLSPYAVTKYVNELYARVYANVYGLKLIGLRYFNVFGPKQNPAGAYAAVIPLFAESLLKNQPPVINGDGSHSRDFTYVENAVEANMLALFTDNEAALNEVYNIAYGDQTSLVELYNYLRDEAGSDLQPIHAAERKGDIKHSLADISKARRLLGYHPLINVKEGLRRTYDWYKQNQNRQQSAVSG